MLKHLFGKRDKELDVLQEEALQSPLRTVVRNFTSNRLAFGGLIVFLVIFLIVLIGPIFNPIDLSEKEETQINVAPGLNMMKVPDGLKGNVKEISTGATLTRMLCILILSGTGLQRILLKCVRILPCYRIF